MLYVTRAQWGARPYRLPGGAIQYAGRRRGVKVHYLGGPYSDRAHDKCAAYVRSIQDLHMDDRGWSDIGYSFVVCTHRYVYEGRGLKRRNSANGNTTLNEQDYAVCALVGSSGLTRPTDPQLHGLRDAIEHCRENGPCGDWIGGHKDGYATSCPGGPLYAWVQAGAPRPGDSPMEDDVTQEEIDKIVAAVTASVVEKVNGAVWMKDVLDAPTPSTTNPTWAAYSFLKHTYLNVLEAQETLGQLGQIELTPEQVAALAAALAADPALVAGLGDAIADKLAARLAE